MLDFKDKLVRIYVRNNRMIALVCECVREREKGYIYENGDL